MEVHISKNPSTARLALAELGPDTSVHGVTDGTWSLVDAIREILRLLGPSDLVIATWTAAHADMREAERLMRSRLILSLRMVVDRSFATRQPKLCEVARELFGDAAIRLWDCHAKFVVASSESDSILYLSSANLNRNRRLETFSAYRLDSVAQEYLQLIDELYRVQKPTDAFRIPPLARADTERVLSSWQK